jgi:hypothetical protein
MRGRGCGRDGVREIGSMAHGALRWLALLGVAPAAQGCRENQQDHILMYEPGTYLGQPDEPLDQEQVDALRQGATRQRSRLATIPG